MLSPAKNLVSELYYLKLPDLVKSYPKFEGCLNCVLFFGVVSKVCITNISHFQLRVLVLLLERYCVGSQIYELFRKTCHRF